MCTSCLHCHLAVNAIGPADFPKWLPVIYVLVHTYPFPVRGFAPMECDALFTLSQLPLYKQHKTLMASLHRGLAFSCLNNHHMSVPLQSPAFRLYQAFHWPATAYGPVQSSLRNHCNIVHFIVGATGLSVITNPKDFTYQTRQSLVARDVKFVGSLLFVLPLFSPFNISSVYESQDK